MVDNFNMVHQERTTEEEQPKESDQPTATASPAKSMDGTLGIAVDKQPLGSGGAACSMGDVKSDASDNNSSNLNSLLDEQLDQHEKTDELQMKKKDQNCSSDDGARDVDDNEICDGDVVEIDHSSGVAAAETRRPSPKKVSASAHEDIVGDDKNSVTSSGKKNDEDTLAAAAAAAATTADASNLGDDIFKNCHISEPASASSTKHQNSDSTPYCDGISKSKENRHITKTTTVIITPTDDSLSGTSRGEESTTATSVNAIASRNSKNQQQPQPRPSGHIYALRDVILESTAAGGDGVPSGTPQDRGASSSVKDSPQDCLITKIDEEQEKRVESCPPRPIVEAYNAHQNEQNPKPPRIVTSHVVWASESVYRQLETMSAGTVLCPSSYLCNDRVKSSMGVEGEDSSTSSIQGKTTLLETMGLLQEKKGGSESMKEDDESLLQFKASIVDGSTSSSPALDTASGVSNKVVDGASLEQKAQEEDRGGEYEGEHSSSSLLIAAVSASVMKKQLESKFIDVSIKYPFSCNEGCAADGEEDFQASSSGAQSRSASKRKRKKLRRLFRSMNCLGNRRNNADRAASSEASTGGVVSRKGLDSGSHDNQGIYPTTTNSRPKMIITNGVIDWENSNLDDTCCHILSHSCSFVAYSASDAESLMMAAGNDSFGVGGGGGDKNNKAVMMATSKAVPTPFLHTSSLGSTIFGDEAVIHNTISPINEIVCVDKSLGIYISESGLSASDCQNIINTSEFCALNRGGWSSYTYAKQTLGCRENDQLAFVCARPVMTACATIRKHLMAATSSDDDNEASLAVKCSGSDEKDTGCELNRPIRRKELVLDVREPHVVKYDTSRVERQKLDMHTDKSEWTFLIALSEGRGHDYKGGGTFFQALNSTVHLQRGQMVIFRGKLRHAGVQIRHGFRYLLVGFLVPAVKTSAASK